MKAKSNFIIAMLIFGSIGLLVRKIPLKSSQISLVRGGVGCFSLLCMSWFSGNKLSWKKIKPNLLLLFIAGVAIGLNWIFLFESYKYTSISNATLSYYFAPIFVMFLSPFILKEKLRWYKVLSILIAMLGMFLIVDSGLDEGINQSHMIGISYGLLAAILYASVILINKFLKNLSGLETTTIQLFIAFIVLLPYVLIMDPIQISQLGGCSVLYLLILGLLHTGFAYYLYFSSMKKLKGQTIAVYSYIDPLTAILMSAIVLGETMMPWQIAGAIMILGASTVNVLDN